jgi:asparagine synthase (glutamine-hydrolysing)
MCGVFGLVYRDRREVPSRARLQESAGRLHHRGPDAAGIYAAPGVGFAHTRLTFLDLDPRSNQPLWDETKRYCIVFNGEIYNYRELRAELQAEGLQFRTTSDTEVLLQLLIRRKPDDALRSLAGMFAFAFYDAAAGELLLARDRFGMKPMNIYEDEGVLMFSSEVKAMYPWWTPELDHFSVASYLLGFHGPTKGFTFYRNLRVLAPGDYVHVKLGEASSTHSWFNLPQFWNDEERERLAGLSDKATIDHVDEQLLGAVRSHLFADVPVGAFCSGGLDSSLLVAMAARITPNVAIFHADIRGKRSEYEAAAALARALKLDLKSVAVTDDDNVRTIPEVMSHYEHPYYDRPNSTALMLVSNLARDSGVKGLLSGEGSDECFLGYRRLGRRRLVEGLQRVGRCGRLLVSRVPLVKRAFRPQSESHLDVRSLFNRRELADDRAMARRELRRLAGDKLLPEHVITIDLLGNYMRSLLHRTDTMGMAASIEARYPFLDNRMVRTGLNLPLRSKLRFSPTVLLKEHPFVREKWVLRKVAERYVPPHVSGRRKIGFSVTTFDRTRVAPEYFETSFVRDLFGLTPRQMTDVAAEADQELLMRLLHLDVWGKVCFEQRSRNDVGARIASFVSVRGE